MVFDIDSAGQRPPIQANYHTSYPDMRLARDGISGSYQPVERKIERTIPSDRTDALSRIPQALHDSYREVLKEAESIWISRQAQYGLTDFAIEDILVLAKIKVSRLRKGGVSEDSLLDLLNYAAIGLMVARGEWK